MLVFQIIIITLHPQSQINMIKRKADELIRNFILHDKRSLHGGIFLYVLAKRGGKTSNYSLICPQRKLWKPYENKA